MFQTLKHTSYPNNVLEHTAKGVKVKQYMNSWWQMPWTDAERIWKWGLLVLAHETHAIGDPTTLPLISLLREVCPNVGF